jgi:hypothetical protein
VNRRRRTSAPRSLLLVVSLLVALVVPVAAAPSATAADLSTFDPGHIITDANFWDSGSMTASEIQAFLSTRGASCVAGEAPCLKDYRQSTATRTPDDRCTGGYTGRADESAAEIIARVAVACGVSPRVILVMLQKEQGLVTGTRPSATRYRSAMGFGCPDTAACDTRYYGFFNQVYQAAWQLRSYALTPSRWQHRAGVVNNVRFHPNAACGTSPVLIRNQATAGLYNYTPYQPNSAALAAGYGTGDACSSYGNRNFFSYYSDWFGNPTGVPPIGSLDSVTATNTSVTFSGWAFDPDSSESVDVHVYVDGVGVAARADRSRPDVGAAYRRGDKHGFAVTLPQAPGRHSTCVHAIDRTGGTNTLLGCRDVVVPDSAPIGNVDAVTANASSITVSGWALDPDTTEPTQVHVYMDGVGHVVSADRSRPDVAAAYNRGDRHGFTVTLDAAPGRHDLCVHAINTVAGPNRLLTCTSVVVSSSVAPPFGVIDAVVPTSSGVTVSGWTIDPDTDAPTDVHVYIDGVGAAVRADQSRPDVAAAFRRGDEHGYTYSRPLAPGPHSMCVHAINTGPGGHTLLGCRSFTVTSSAPIGALDAVVPGPGSVTVSGWTLDPDTTEPVEAHVYIDGVGVAVRAAESRPDVAAAFGRGDKHGFTYTAPMTPGRHSLCVHGIDMLGSPNTLLGCRDFVVP